MVERYFLHPKYLLDEAWTTLAESETRKAARADADTRDQLRDARGNPPARVRLVTEADIEVDARGLAPGTHATGFRRARA
jgi:hypothetical protein